MAHIVRDKVRIWRKKTLIYSETQTEQKYEFAAEADIFMKKF